ncbi:chalcone isomerase family protein [Pseudoduganella violaceinigra]|uniref:chalcone isomerase family protein n=1 Tax=Pseudoduganella violaceinigra TaxID=246602 RepID=UPI0004007CE4|nr:chalcone isomerase family protein [Pseudoduganella violaceinigra]
MCLSLALTAPAKAADNGGGWRDAFPAAVAVGSGEMRWFGLRIYHAALWCEQRPFDPAARFALQLTYHRSISRERLVQTSLDEMRRLGTAPNDPSLQKQWENQLRKAFVDVEPGDQLIGVNQPGYGMRLFDQRKLLAEIPDPDLARAFFAIWLNEASRDQGLRRQLLGGRQ